MSLKCDISNETLQGPPRTVRRDEQWLLSKHCRYQAFSRLKINSQTESRIEIGKKPS